MAYEFDSPVVSSLAPPTTTPQSPRELLTQGALGHRRRVKEIFFAPIGDRAELREVQRLRARAVVKRQENGQASLVDGLDQDAYDEIALHVAGWLDGEVVATGRMIVATDDDLLPVERAFGLRLDDRASLVEVGRVVVAPEVAGTDHRVLLALLGELWLQAGGRHCWAGANHSAVIRLYRSLGAQPRMLGPDRQVHGERRFPVVWDMNLFAPSFFALSQR